MCVLDLLGSLNWATIITTFATIVMALVAYRQWQTTTKQTEISKEQADILKNQERIALFDKRMEVVQAINAIKSYFKVDGSKKIIDTNLYYSNNNNGYERVKILNKLEEDIHKSYLNSEYLFGKEIVHQNTGNIHKIFSDLNTSFKEKILNIENLAKKNLSKDEFISESIKLIAPSDEKLTEETQKGNDLLVLLNDTKMWEEINKYVDVKHLGLGENK